MTKHTRGTYVDQHRPADLSGFGSRRSRRAQQYEAFLPELVADVDLRLPGDVAADLADVEARLLRLRDHAHGVDGFESLARSLLRSEAVASSWIEALEVSHRRLAEAEHGAPGQRFDGARRVLGNVRAMAHAAEVGGGDRPLAVEDLLEMHRLLLADSNRVADRDRAGALREEPVFIGGVDARTAEFVGPPHAEVPRLLDDLVDLVNDRQDLTGVTVAALAHAQFETIHPFHDGNGRVGRCLVHAVLRRRGLVGQVLVPWSVVLARRGADYVTGLGLFRDDHLDEWISFVATTLSEAADATTGLATAVRDLQSTWRRDLDTQRRNQGLRAARRDAAVLELLTVLPGMPVLQVPDVAERLAVTTTTAQTAVDELVEIGILRQVSAGRRNRVFETKQVFDLLERFERRPEEFVARDRG